MSGELTPESLMTKAIRAIASARLLFADQDVDGACNRACYAMFDAARAALLSINAPVPPDIGKTHGGLISAITVPPAPTFSRGFTLTEMAVVLVIVALLIGGMMLPMSAQQDIRYVTETQKVLNDARDAILGFAAANGRLPCPATAASKGSEQPAGGGVCSCVSPDCFLPAATLGISPINSNGQAVDGWQFPIRYAVTSANANAFTTSDGMKGAWSGGLAPNLTICATGACTSTLASNAVAVIWSTGKNSLLGGTSPDEKENPNPNTGAGNPDPSATTFVSREPGADFDDLLIWLSPNILYNRMITAGKLP